MTKRKGKVEIRRYLTPEKAKVLKLKQVSDAQVMEEMERDWSTDSRVFVDMGDFYSYNPNRPDFIEAHLHFKSVSDKATAALLLSRLAMVAHHSGVSEADVKEWISQQITRWEKERRWERLN